MTSQTIGKVYKGKDVSRGGHLDVMHRALHIVHLDSDSSRNYHPYNHAQDFTIQLREELMLEPSDRWTCCLIQSSLPFEKNQEVTYLCCDLCVYSVVGDFDLPILRVIYPHGSKYSHFYNKVHVPLKQGQVSAIRIYLLSESGDPRSFVPGTTYCTLEFHKHWQSTIPQGRQ